MSPPGPDRSASIIGGWLSISGPVAVVRCDLVSPNNATHASLCLDYLPAIRLVAVPARAPESKQSMHDRRQPHSGGHCPVPYRGQARQPGRRGERHASVAAADQAHKANDLIWPQHRRLSNGLACTSRYALPGHGPVCTAHCPEPALMGLLLYRNPSNSPRSTGSDHDHQVGSRADHGSAASLSPVPISRMRRGVIGARGMFHTGAR
jgi:hypothetical protein